MTAVNRSGNGAVSLVNAAVTGDFRQGYDRKTTTSKVFDEIETDQESTGSSSSDMENWSPKSVVPKVRKWPALKDVFDVRGGGVIHSQILRIRAEDSHLGEDIGECVVSKQVVGKGEVAVMISSRLASPLSGNLTNGALKF